MRVENPASERGCPFCSPTPCGPDWAGPGPGPRLLAIIIITSKLGESKPKPVISYQPRAPPASCLGSGLSVGCPCQAQRGPPARRVREELRWASSFWSILDPGPRPSKDKLLLESALDVPARTSTSSCGGAIFDTAPLLSPPTTRAPPRIPTHTNRPPGPHVYARA